MVDQPAAAPAAPAAAPAAAAPAPEAWHTGLDAETVGYLTNRGLEKGDAKAAFLNAAQAHREAEKLLGAGVQNLARLPKDINDTATRDALWNKLGRPVEPAGYDYTGVEGVDADFLKFMNPIFHANGVTNEAAKTILKSVTAEALRVEGEAQKAREVIMATEKDALLKEWGGAATANLVVAQAAFKKLGISDEQSTAIEKQLGFGKTMSLFFSLGQKIGEDPFVNPNPGSLGPARITTKEGALERKKALMADTQWREAFLANKSENIKEMTALNTLLSSD